MFPTLLMAQQATPVVDDAAPAMQSLAADAGEAPALAFNGQPQSTTMRLGGGVPETSRVDYLVRSVRPLWCRSVPVIFVSPYKPDGLTQLPPATIIIS